MTPLQQNRLLKIILGLVVAALLWILLAPGTGVYSLLKLRNHAFELEKLTRELTANNETLRAEIDRLKNDRAYLEQVAREKYGMLKKNERVFDFSQSREKEKND